MWLSLLMNKWVWTAVALAAIMIFIGALLYKNQSLKSTIAEKEVEIVSLNGQLESAKLAIAGYKGTLDGKDSEIAACQEQSKLGNDAIVAYKDRIDKLAGFTRTWKSIPVVKTKEILDDASNTQAIQLLNDCIARVAPSADRLWETKDQH